MHLLFSLCIWLNVFGKRFISLWVDSPFFPNLGQFLPVVAANLTKCSFKIIRQFDARSGRSNNFTNIHYFHFQMIDLIVTIDHDSIANAGSYFRLVF